MLAGHYPVRWTAPVYSKDIGRGELEVWMGYPLPKPVEDAVAVQMQTHGRTLNGMWRILYRDMTRIATPIVDGTEPFNCFSWARPAAKPRDVMDLGAEWDRKDFLDSLFERGIGRSRIEVEWLWTQFLQHALDWLINKERELDLGFCRLIPTPYRANSPSLEETNKNLDWDRFVAVCRRRIQIEHSEAWWQSVRVAEVFRLATLGPFEYCESVFMSMIRSRPAMLRCNADLYQQCRRPHPRVFEGSHPGLRRFAALSKPRKSYYVRPPGPRKPGRRFTTIEESRKKRVYKAAPHVRNLPGLRGWYANLRATGRNAWHERRNGRTIRVLVLPSGESPPPGCVLAGGADKRPKGVAP